MSSTKITKGPWKPKALIDMSSEEFMLHLFKLFMATADKETKQAVFSLLCKYCVTAQDLGKIPRKPLD